MSCGNPRPTVSVVVPVWGAERTLDRCVQSILGQRLRTGTLACVLVDDGSPDRCGAMCDEYARRDARVRVLHKEDGGVSSARNAGLRASEGRVCRLPGQRRRPCAPARCRRRWTPRPPTPARSFCGAIPTTPATRPPPGPKPPPRRKARWRGCISTA